MSRYCARADLGAAARLTSLTDDQVNGMIELASAMFDTEAATQMSVPLETWPDVLRVHVARVARGLCFDELVGYRPDGSDSLIREGYLEGIRFFERVGAGKVVLAGSDSDGENIAITPSAVPEVYSDEERGI